MFIISETPLNGHDKNGAERRGGNFRILGSDATPESLKERAVS